MNLEPPPATFSGRPVTDVLPANTVLHRVHSDYPAEAFNWTAQPDTDDGGRFDALDGTFGYTYLGLSPQGAIAETMCRDLPLDQARRVVPYSRIIGRHLSEVTTTRNLLLLSLQGPDLSQVNAPLALTKCEPTQYLTTRAWAAALRRALPDVAGFRYRCRHDEDQVALVLFEDGLPPAPARAHGALAADPTRRRPLEEPAGLQLLLQVLRTHNATLGAPGPIASSASGTPRRRPGLAMSVDPTTGVIVYDTGR